MFYLLLAINATFTQKRHHRAPVCVVLGLGIFDVPVDIDHSRSLLEDLLDLRSKRNLPFVVWTVDLRDERLQDWRTA